jgi:DNA-binding transcriptional LysR family regulator
MGALRYTLPDKVGSHATRLFGLANGDLVEIFPGKRMDTPYGYFLIEGPRSGARPEVQAFSAWLLAQAWDTRLAIEGA